MNRIINRLDSRFGQAVKFIISPDSPPMMSRKDILKELDLTEDDVQGRDLLNDEREKRAMSRLIYRDVISEEASLDRNSNLHVLLRIFRVQDYLEHIVAKGRMSRKSEGLLMLRAFKLPVNQWISNRLMNTKRVRVKRLAMYASIMAGSNKDLEYFESDFFDNNCCLYDEIQLGYVLQRRKTSRQKIPNLAALALHQSNPSTQSVFVRLMRYFNQKEYCEELDDLFMRNNDNELIDEIARTWGYLDYKAGEEMMQEMIITQNDSVKITIMHALARLGTGNSTNIFLDAYFNSSDQKVRYEALRCLWNYGSDGRARFREIERNCLPQERFLFEFFHNDITREDIPLTKSSTYHQRYGDNIYTTA